MEMAGVIFLAAIAMADVKRRPSKNVSSAALVLAQHTGRDVSRSAILSGPMCIDPGSHPRTFGRITLFGTYYLNVASPPKPSLINRYVRSLCQKSQNVCKISFELDIFFCVTSTLSI